MPTQTNIPAPVSLKAPTQKAVTNFAPGKPGKHTRSRQQVLEQIAIRWKEMVCLCVTRSEPPIQIGITLLKAKRSLGPGRFRALLEVGEFGLEKRRAAKLMRIAANKVLANPQYHAMLPSSEDALTQLADLDAAILERAIRIGTVHRTMTEEEASSFANRNRSKTTLEAGISPLDFDGNMAAARLAERIMDDVAHWPPGERGRASELLGALAEQIWGESQPSPMRRSL